MTQPDPNEVRDTGALAQAIAANARRAIGPEGTVLRASEADAPMLRASYIAKLGEAAMKILDGDEVWDNA